MVRVARAYHLVHGSKIHLENPDWYSLVADPQTSGGLLIAIDSGFKEQMESILSENNLYSRQIGKFVDGAENELRIRIS